MERALVVVGVGWTLIALAMAIVTRRPVALVDSADARREWGRLHRFDQPVADLPSLIGGYVAAIQRVARPLARAGLMPNAITLVAPGPAAVAAGLIGWRGAWAAVGGALVLVVGLLDGFDGAVAALTGRATRFGDVLDSTVDRAVEVIILTGPVVHDRRTATAAAAAAALVSVLLLEYVRARVQMHDPAVTRITPAERPTRIIAIAMGAIGAATIDPPSWYWPSLLWALAGLTALGIALLLRDAARVDSRP